MNYAIVQHIPCKNVKFAVMPVDYLLEMVAELGNILRAIINRKKDEPAKALEEIKVAFRSTKFRDKQFFDDLSPEALAAFLQEQQMDYRAVDHIIDILLEEAEIKNDGDKLLPAKIQVLIKYVSDKEAGLKIFSLKRNTQVTRLQTYL
jgi:hypothetical protein